MPIYIERKLYGFFGFESSVEDKKFTTNDINLLKIFTEVISRAFTKYISEKRIKKLTFNDSLTGLYNRRFFKKELERLDTKRQLPISIIVADLNGLKIVNDSYGHKKGDKLLIRTAKLLKSVLRDEDILVRLGGDEFAILLPQTSTEEGKNIIKRIKNMVNKDSQNKIPISIALGISSKTNVEKDLEIGRAHV